LLENTDDEMLIEKTCYICGVDLLQQYKRDNGTQNDLNASKQKFPQMTRWDGQKKEVCASCFKSVEEGVEVYRQNHPKWRPPKPTGF